jgi:hypothetical protein
MKKRLAQFQRLSDYVLIEPDGRYYVFGQGVHDAAVIVGTHHTKSSRSQVLKISPTAKPSNEQRKKKLLWCAREFGSLDAGDLLGSFSILSNDQKSVRDAIKETKASHIEFECDRTSAKAFLFDVASQDAEVLWRSSFVSKGDGIELHNVHGVSASFVMKAQTFLRLPNEAYSVSVFQDYAVLSSSKDGTLVYLRDQDVRRPYTTFVSDRLLCPITFLFHPKS